MRTATVRDLRFKFAEVEELLRDGEEVQITKRKRIIARLVPASRPTRRKQPDFLARLKRIYGEKVLDVSGADLIAKERDRY